MKHTAITVVALGILGASGAVVWHRLGRPDPAQSALAEMDFRMAAIEKNLERACAQQAQLGSSIESNAASFDRLRVIDEKWSKLYAHERDRAAWNALWLTAVLSRDDLRRIDLKIRDLCEATRKTEDTVHALREIEPLIAALLGASSEGVDTALAKRQVAERLREADEAAKVELAHLAGVESLIADYRRSLDERRQTIASLRPAAVSGSDPTARGGLDLLNLTEAGIKVSLALLDQLDDSASGLMGLILSSRRAADA